MTFELLPYAHKAQTIYLTDKFYRYLVQNSGGKQSLWKPVKTETFEIYQEEQQITQLHERLFEKDGVLLPFVYNNKMYNNIEDFLYQEGLLDAEFLENNLTLELEEKLYTYVDPNMYEKDNPKYRLDFKYNRKLQPLQCMINVLRVVSNLSISYYTFRKVLEKLHPENILYDNKEFVESELKSPLIAKIYVGGKLIYFKDESDVLDYLTTLTRKSVKEIKEMLDDGATYLQAALYRNKETWLCGNAENMKQQKFYSSFMEKVDFESKRTDIIGEEATYIHKNYHTLASIAIQAYRCYSKEPVQSPYNHLTNLTNSLSLTGKVKLIKEVKKEK